MKRRVQNRVVICVDDILNDDVSGRLFTQYNNEPIVILNSMQMFNQMEDMYDRINFPQSSVRIRGFGKATNSVVAQERISQVRTSTDLMEFRGGKATFAIDVTSRQNATWQGVIYWIEEDILKEFSSFMDMLALIDSATK